MNNKLNNKQITLYITFAPHLSHTNTWPECHVVKFSSTNNFCIWKLCTLHSFGFGKNKIFLLTLLTLQTTLFRSFSFAYMVKVFDVFWINNRNKKGPKKNIHKNKTATTTKANVTSMCYIESETNEYSELVTPKWISMMQVRHDHLYPAKKALVHCLSMWIKPYGRINTPQNPPLDPNRNLVQWTRHVHRFVAINEKLHDRYHNCTHHIYDDMMAGGTPAVLMWIDMFAGLGVKEMKMAPFQQALHLFDV